MQISQLNPKLLSFGLLLCAFILLFLNFLPIHLELLAASGHPWESFDPVLANRLQPIDQMEALIDSEANARGVDMRSVAYGNIAVRAVRQRFYHGYSRYSLKENWIAAVAGKLFWSQLSAIVLPEDIMKYPMAACSQQSIVLMELFRRKGIDYRKVGFEHHFALEGEFGNAWYLFDPDMEPDFSTFPHNSYSTLKKQGTLLQVYQNRLDPAEIANGFTHQYYGRINEAAAPNAALFHQVTKALSKVLWVFPFLIWMLLYLKKMRQNLVQRRSTISYGYADAVVPS